MSKAFFRSSQIDDLVGGHTALHVACRQGHCDIIRELLERGANMDTLVGDFFLNLFFFTVIFCSVQNYCHLGDNKETQDRHV